MNRGRAALVLALLLGRAVHAHAADAAIPCAECLVFAASPADRHEFQAAGIDVAVEVPLAGLPAVDPRELDAPLLIIDAGASTLGDEEWFALRSVVTRFRAAHNQPRVGLTLRPTATTRSVAELSAYFDFLVVPAGAEFDRLADTSGIEVWSDATPSGSVDLDILTVARPPRSDRVLVRVGRSDLPLVRAVAALRDWLPGGLTPLPGVTVTCEPGCVSSSYLHPSTLDAIALVRPSGSATRIVVAPTALELLVSGDGALRGTGPALDLPGLSTPFVLRIRGWRGVTEDAFATATEVSGARQLRVEEIIARHQAAQERQQRAIDTLISSGSTVLTFQVPGFAAPLSVTARTTMFTGGGQTDIEQAGIQINGLDLERRGGVPRLPLIEPERVNTPPLAIALTEAFGYALVGRERIKQRDTYIVTFVPTHPTAASFAGRAWIDAVTFRLVKMDASQTALRGPIVSSRQVDDYDMVRSGADDLALLHRSEIFQLYQGPTQSTPIHRIVTIDRHELNAPDYQARLAAAYGSDAVMLRDTPDGYRFLTRDRQATGDAPTRNVAATAVSHVATAVAGVLVDPNISVPLVFGGVSYVDFNLFGTGAQLNAFFAGTYARVSWSTPPLFGGGWRVAGDGSLVALFYNDRAIRGGIEHYDENVRQRPALFSAALVGPVGPSLRLRAGYEVGYTRYERGDTTAPTFAVPPSTPVHTARVAVEVEHGPWSATGWVAASRRQRWQAWGFDPLPAEPAGRAFERAGATLGRSFVWSPRAVGHIEAAWMGGWRLDRFSQFAFGSFDNPLRGYPSVSIRYRDGAALRTVATWTALARLRLDGFADVGVVRAEDSVRARAYPGVGAALETPVPFGWLLAAEWGYGVRGVNTSGTAGTHVVRVTGYKVF